MGNFHSWAGQRKGATKGCSVFHVRLLTIGCMHDGSSLVGYLEGEKDEILRVVAGRRNPANLEPTVGVLLSLGNYTTAPYTVKKGYEQAPDVRIYLAVCNLCIVIQYSTYKCIERRSSSQS